MDDSMDHVHEYISLVKGDINEIKAILKELSKGFNHLTVVDERIANLIKMDLKMSENLEDYDRRLRALELKAKGSDRTSLWVERFLVALAGAALMFVAKAVGLI
jgi:K+/H+ antiporter YhaU regulatory subunit KhtT